jgi:hypothetical protein
MIRGRRNSSSDDGVTGCLAYVLLGLFLMPILGLVFISSKDPDKKTLGWILLVVGIILWIIVGVGSA